MGGFPRHFKLLAFLSVLAACSAKKSGKETPPVPGAQGGGTTTGGTAGTINNGNANNGNGTAGSQIPDAPAGITYEVECKLPRFTDPYIGFTIGKPEGWNANYSGGTINIFKDEDGLSTVFVYPVRMATGNTAQSVFQSYTEELSKAVKASGASISIQNGKIDAVTKSGKKLVGQVSFKEAGRDLVISGGWAPVAEWDAVKGTTEEVARCYQRIPGTPLKLQEKTGGGAYTTRWAFAIPETWSVYAATGNGIDLTNGDGATLVSYAFATNSPYSDPEAFLNYLDIQLRNQTDVVETTTLKKSTTEPVQDSLGQTWKGLVREFTQTLKNGSKTKGITTVLLGGFDTYWNHLGFAASSTVIVSHRRAKVEDWDKMLGLLTAIQGTIKIKSANSNMRSTSLPRNNPADSSSIMSSWEYRNRSQDRTSSNFSEAILGYENTHSPTTNESYQMPFNSYDATGADGPGYYRDLPGGGREKLVLDTP